MLSWTSAWYASEWLIRLVMLIHVPQRRTTAAARSWLLLIFLLPGPGALLYWFIGRPYVARRRIDLQQRVELSIRTIVGSSDPPALALAPPFTDLPTLARNLGDFALQEGNRIELLPDYEGTIDRLIADIKAATHHVHLLYYIFMPDRTGQRVMDALIQAAGRGVHCRLLVDGAGSRAGLRGLRARLEPAGVTISPLLPVGLLHRSATRFDLRNHRKIALIDGRIGYVGSQNIVDAEFKKGLVYEELSARVTGPVVRQLQAVLLADLDAETQHLTTDAEFFPELSATGTSAAVVVPSGPSYPYLNNLELMVALTHAAQKRIVFTSPYFVPTEALLAAMRTAVLRGVEVDLIVARQVDQWLVGLAQRSFYEPLLEVGVRIHQYRPRFLHAKHLTFDDRVALIGSSNMDIRSFQLNEEISLLIHDPAVVAELGAIQRRTMADADHLTLEDWRRRPPVQRILQNVARLTDSLL